MSLSSITAVAVSGKVGPVKPVNHTCLVAVVTPTDRPKSVRNRCVIELFCDVVCVVTLPFWHFCWCRGFCHRTESDLFLFLLHLANIVKMVYQKHDIKLLDDNFLLYSIQSQILGGLLTTTQSFRAAIYHIVTLSCTSWSIIIQKLQKRFHAGNFNVDKRPDLLYANKIHKM